MGVTCRKFDAPGYLLTNCHAVLLIDGMTDVNYKAQEELFEREIDWYCAGATLRRPRCREWTEFSRRFVEHCFTWNGCWVAEEAIREWLKYLSSPEGEYSPLEYGRDWHFRR